jgi:hypothetical protein
MLHPQDNLGGSVRAGIADPQYREQLPSLFAEQRKTDWDTLAHDWLEFCRETWKYGRLALVRATAGTTLSLREGTKRGGCLIGARRQRRHA